MLRKKLHAVNIVSRKPQTWIGLEFQQVVQRILIQPWMSPA
ncbi:hypothetical protein C4J98_2882 [Pseudomonas orientalis]|nr:hypothetical protein C4J98_2882 [Pseudomonas orientalis]